MLLLTAAVIGGSFYMLGFSLRPEETMRAKNATAYEYMYAEYPFLRPWPDSLERAGALRDTVIVDPQGVRLRPTARPSSSMDTPTAPCGC